MVFFFLFFSLCPFNKNFQYPGLYEFCVILVQCSSRFRYDDERFHIFEETGVHLVCCFENEKKGLSYIWKCPGNEQRVKKIIAECCLFNSKSSLLFYEPFLFLDWLPWRDSNKEVWNTPGWKAEYVKSMDHWSKIFILIFWLEHFTNERRHSWLLRKPPTAGTSVSLQGVRNISAHWTSMGKPLFTEQVLQDLTKFPNSSFP